MTNIKKSIVTSTDLDYWTDCLYIKIKQSGIEYTDIIGIARGGLILSQKLAYMLNIRRVYSFGISHYSASNKKRSKPYVYQKPRIRCGENKNILIVDELSDTGETILDLLKLLGPKKGIVHSAVWIRKNGSKVNNEYVAQEFDQEVWVVFPWDIKC